MSSSRPEDDTPLGLTVHSMPEPHIPQAPNRKRTVLGRWKMMLVFLICAAPVIASYTTYYLIRPEGRRNYGALIQPQRPMPPMVGTLLDGTPFALQSLKAQWLLVTVSSGACDAQCANHLYFQRQLRESLGREKDRLDRVWLITDNAPVSDALLPALRGATVVRVSSAELAAWLAPDAGQALPDHLYVVDPMANWMMRFPAGISIDNASKFKRDLDRLLRASASWDEAGR